MRENKLIVQINKPLREVFMFTITPPNSTRWITNVVDEKTNEWPAKKGTIYILQTKEGKFSEVTISDIKENKFVEWISKDQNYHCRYSFKTVSKNVTELEYYEWVEKGELEEPFTEEILNKLKVVLERFNMINI